MILNVKKFNKQLRESVKFEQYNFKEIKVDSYNWKFIRETEYKTDLITYAFSKDKWSDELILNPISAYIVFPIINKILFTVIKDNRYSAENYDEIIYKCPNFDLKIDYYVDIQRNLFFVKNKIVYEDVFQEALSVFKEQFETSVLPFFDKIQTIQQVNDEILEKYEQREWTKYILGETMFKALIIMKLCKNRRYIEISINYKQNILNAINDGHTEYQEFYNTLVALLDFLDSGKYLELIEK